MYIPTETYEDVVKKANYLHKLFLLWNKKGRDSMCIAHSLNLGRMTASTKKGFDDFLTHFFAPFEEYMPLGNNLEKEDQQRIIADLVKFSDISADTFDGLYPKQVLKKIRKFRSIF